MENAQRYIVESMQFGTTREDLNAYLNTDPHPNYRLVSCQFLNCSYTLVWELKD